MFAEAIDGRTSDAPTWSDRYEGWYREVERAYARLGHSLGFNPPITSSLAALESRPRLLLMGLNPAGSKDYPEHRGRRRYDHDDIYLGTSWDDYPPGRAPLQRQVAMLLREIQRRLGNHDPLEHFARDRIVSASLVPFRSPSESLLHDRDRTLSFARTYWTAFLGHWRPDFAVCFGTTPFDELTALLGRTVESRHYDPKWQGALRLRVFQDGTRALGVPHMSRFPIFGRAASASAIQEAFDDLMQSSCGAEPADPGRGTGPEGDRA
jgi:hypothetical protein